LALNFVFNKKDNSQIVYPSVRCLLKRLKILGKRDFHGRSSLHFGYFVINYFEFQVSDIVPIKDALCCKGLKFGKKPILREFVESGYMFLHRRSTFI